jgi:uncharacterized protein (DUF433 family)
MGYGDIMDRITTEPGQRSNPRIRGTPITVWDVYRALSLPGMTDCEVLSKYPELEPDDLAAVQEGPGDPDGLVDFTDLGPTAGPPLNRSWPRGAVSSSSSRS